MFHVQCANSRPFSYGKDAETEHGPVVVDVVFAVTVAVFAFACCCCRCCCRFCCFVCFCFVLVVFVCLLACFFVVCFAVVVVLKSRRENLSGKYLSFFFSFPGPRF